MSAPRLITTTIEGGVATLTLSNPGGANAMSPAWGVAFRADIDRIKGDDSVKVVVLRSEGKAFCVGGDIASFAAAADVKAELHALANDLHAGILKLIGLEAPLVVAVQGVAAGAGMSLVCAADIAIAGESASFTAAYTAAGLSPDGGMSWLLPRLVGTRRATELLLTNRRVKSAEAAEIGLVTETVADDALDARVAEVVDALLAGSRAAQGATRRLLRAAETTDLQEQLALEADSISTLAAGPGGQEGIHAFLEKRRPTFPV